MSNELRIAKNDKERGSMESYIIHKALYEGVLEKTSDPAVREIALQKLDSLQYSTFRNNIVSDFSNDLFSYNDPSPNSSTLEQLLSKCQGSLSASDEKRARELISNISSPSVQHYYECLLLKASQPASRETWEKMRYSIQKAIEQDPANPVYTQLLSDINSAVAQYDEQYRVWAKEKQDELNRIHSRNTIVRGFSLLGQGVSTLVSLFVFGFCTAFCIGLCRLCA